MDHARLTRFVDGCWGDEIVPTLVEYISIPNKSPAFDPDWAAHGYMEDAVRLFARWARRKLAGIAGATPRGGAAAGPHAGDLHRYPGRRRRTRVLLYGHLDKQPEMTGWAEGTGPWTPVLKGEQALSAAAAPTTATRCSAR